MIPKNPNWIYDLFTVYNEEVTDSIETINDIRYIHKINFKKEKG